MLRVVDRCFACIPIALRLLGLLVAEVIAPGGGTIGGDYIGPLKAVHIDDDAELRLIYWQVRTCARQIICDGMLRSAADLLAGSNHYGRHLHLNIDHSTIQCMSNGRGTMRSRGHRAAHQRHPPSLRQTKDPTEQATILQIR